jgi:molecular chaperone DnaJ
MSKNYYVLLGIASDATQEEIKSAYREKAKRWHPDRSGGGSEPFLAIREAYEVLCDPGRRQAYDQERASQETDNQRRARKVRPEQARARPAVEPLVPDWGGRGSHGRFSTSRLSPLPGEFFRDPWIDLEVPARPQPGKRFEEVDLEVWLTREEARRGGRIRVLVPVRLWCPACQGRGGVGLFACSHCLGSGTVVGEGPVDITYPGGLVDGFEGTVSLVRPGMRDLVLVLRFRIDQKV